MTARTAVTAIITSLFQRYRLEAVIQADADAAAQTRLFDGLFERPQFASPR
jgi:hypothetical protein